MRHADANGQGREWSDRVGCAGWGHPAFKPGHWGGDLEVETEEAIAELGFTGAFEEKLVIKQMAEACRTPAKQQNLN